MRVIQILITTFLLGSVCSQRSVTLTCGGDSEPGERGLPGVPGKRGPPGVVGSQGVKGEKGASEDTEDSFLLVENRLKELEKLSTTFLRARDCLSHYNAGSESNGVYGIFADNEIKQVYCDQETDGGGWLVFQNRFDGSVDFVRNWYNYTHGFGSPTGEYWLGLDLLHFMTNSHKYELRIDLKDWDNNVRYAKYSTFEIGSADDLYRLKIGGYSGNAGDAMAHHNKKAFTTIDNDNDETDGNCARNGAWWYVACYDSNLNGWYLTGRGDTIQATSWGGWRGHLYSLKETKMMIRPT